MVLLIVRWTASAWEDGPKPARDLHRCTLGPGTLDTQSPLPFLHAGLAADWRIALVWLMTFDASPSDLRRLRSDLERELDLSARSRVSGQTAAPEWLHQNTSRAGASRFT